MLLMIRTYKKGNAGCPMVTVTLEAPGKQHLNSSENYDFEETLEKQFSGGAAGFYPNFKRCLEASPYLMCSGMTPTITTKEEFF